MSDERDNRDDEMIMQQLTALRNELFELRCLHERFTARMAAQHRLACQLLDEQVAAQKAQYYKLRRFLQSHAADEDDGEWWRKGKEQPPWE